MESLSSPSVASRTTFTELPEHSRTSTLPPTSLTPITPTMSLSKEQGNMLFGSYMVKPQPRTSDESISLEWAFGLNTDYKAILHNLSSKTFNTAATPLTSTQHGITSNSSPYNKGRRSLRGAVVTTSNSSNNKNTTNTMTTMSREIRKVFYAIGHIGVIYDVMNNTQRHLLGHTHTIIASSATFNKRFVATIDEGDRNLWYLRKGENCKRNENSCNHNNNNEKNNDNEESAKNASNSINGGMDNDINRVMSEEVVEDDAEVLDGKDTIMYSPEQVYKPEEDDGSLLIIWDTVSCLPVQTIPIGKFGGASCVAISADGLYVAVINRRTPQQLIVWGWTAEESKNTILNVSKKWMSEAYNCRKNTNTTGVLTRNMLTTRNRFSTDAPFAASNTSLSVTNTTLPSTEPSQGKAECNKTDNNNVNIKVSKNAEMINIHDKVQQCNKSELRSRKASYTNKSIDPSNYDDDDDEGDEDEEENSELHVLWPEHVRVIPSNDVQVNVHFAIDNAQMLCTNGKRRVFFWSWSEGLLKYYSPPSFRSNTRKPSMKRSTEHTEQTQHNNGVSIDANTVTKNSKDNKNSSNSKKKQKQFQEKEKHVEQNEEKEREKYHLTQTILIPGTSMAAGGSSSGHLILWEVQPEDRITKPQDKTLLKTIHAHSNGVNCLTYQNGTIVTGGNDGHVKFFDLQLRMVAWFDALCAGPIYSISFDRYTLSLQESIHLFVQDNKLHLSRTGADAANAFCSPNFMIATSHAMIIDVPSASFHAGVRSTLTKGRLISQGQDHALECVSAHPSLPRVAIAGYSGQIHLWDYVQKRVLVLSLFKQLAISCLLFDPAGTCLAVGCTSGQVKFLNAETLEEIKAFRPKRVECVSKMCFSADGRMMAVGTRQGCVGLYEYKHPQSNHTKPMTWEFIGFHKTHRDTIVGLQFGHNTQGELIRLLSIGADKRLIEYNLIDSHTETGLLVRTAHKITQGPQPTGFVWTKEKKILDRQSEPRRLQTWSKEDDDNSEKDESEDDEDEDNESSDYDEDDDDENEANGRQFSATNSSDESAADQSCTQPAYSAKHRHRKNHHRQHNRNKPEVDYLLIATNDYKIKVYQSDWTRQCVKTLLSPTFGGPVEQMAIVMSIKETMSATNNNNNNNNNKSTQNQKDEYQYMVQTKQKWLVYTTSERVMGLMQLPLVGDPCASTGLIAHPLEITSMSVSYDGQYVFTTGGNDQSMMQWRVNGFSMESALVRYNTTHQEIEKNGTSKMKVKECKGEVPLDHLLCMIDGGASGQTVKEIMDYFYYAQVRAQGEITTARRELLGAVHFSQVPHLFRALGYYPSELEMGHLAYEVANMYSDKSEALAEVDVDAILLNFAQFVRLYVNHRPLKGITRNDIEQAFVNIAHYVTHSKKPSTSTTTTITKNNKTNKAQIALDRNKLFELLSTLGEPLKNSEISAAVTSLLGDGVHLNMLPVSLNACQFAENFLGFMDYHTESDNTIRTSNATSLKEQSVQNSNKNSRSVSSNSGGSMSREAFINPNVNADEHGMKKGSRHSQRHRNHFGKHQKQNEFNGAEHHSEYGVEKSFEEQEEYSESEEDEEGLYGPRPMMNEQDARRHQLYGNDVNSDSDVSSEIIDEDDDRFVM